MKSYNLTLAAICLLFTALSQASDNQNNKNNSWVLQYIFSPITDKMNESTDKVINQMETSTTKITSSFNRITDCPSWLITGSAAYGNAKMIQFAAKNPRYALPVAAGVITTTALSTKAYDQRTLVIKNNSDQQ